jgi:hypothetical protein
MIWVCFISVGGSRGFHTARYGKRGYSTHLKHTHMISDASALVAGKYDHLCDQSVKHSIGYRTPKANQPVAIVRRHRIPAMLEGLVKLIGVKLIFFAVPHNLLRGLT